MLGIAIGHMLGAKNGDNRVTRFGDGAIRGGWLGFLVGIVVIASSPSAAQMDFSAIMPAFSVVALTSLYGYFRTCFYANRLILSNYKLRIYFWLI